MAHLDTIHRSNVFGKKAFFCGILICMYSLGIAQEVKQNDPEKKVANFSYKIIGSVILSAHKHNENSTFSTFVGWGGPSIRLVLKKFEMSYGVFPSLRLYESNHQLVVNPILGTGFQFAYKNIVLVTPTYYILSPRTKTNTWIVSLGVGYRFLNK